MHIDRSIPCPHSLGKYSELLATAAFLAEGAQVAVPYGNQKDWDLLVQRDAATWLRVQVKTARRSGGQTIVKLCNKSGRCYSPDDVDLLVAVLPETGDIWRMRIEEIAGKKTIGLASKQLWISGSGGSPRLKEGERAKGFLTKELRGRIAPWVAEAAPSGADLTNWDMVKLWSSGTKCHRIGEVFGFTIEATRDRITRTIRRHFGEPLLSGNQWVSSVQAVGEASREVV